MCRALFLDRDGTIIEDTGYVRRVEDVRLLPGVREALARLSAQGFRLVLVSNQSGIARGMFGRAELEAVHARMMELLAPVTFDAVRYCEHGPNDGCACRKPAPGMLLDAAEQLGLDLASSIMVGDKPSDLEAGRAAGCLGALLGSGVDRTPLPRYVAETWAELARQIAMAAPAPHSVLRSFPGKHVVVVGDVMLDEFVRGDVSRISPEAPVPVIELRERVRTPGGAANAAANVVSLGGRATLLGVIGADAEGRALRDEVQARGIDASALTIDAARPTTHKMRIIARSQQIVRIDAESRAPLSAEVEAALIASIESALASADACILSDYAKGVVSERVAQATIVAAHREGIPVVVDPKGKDFKRYRGATVVTPNTSELEAATGEHPHDSEAIDRLGNALLPGLEGAALLVTRGPQGMTLLEKDQSPFHLPTAARQVYDVTGAGDTVVGTLALALTANAGDGAPVAIRDVLEIASRAAGVVVGKAGTATVTPEELLRAFAHD